MTAEPQAPNPHASDPHTQEGEAEALAARRNGWGCWRVLLWGLLAVVLVCAALAAWVVYDSRDLDPQLLEAQYTDDTSSFVTVENVRVHVRDQGPRTAPALVMIHGFGAHLQAWDAWADALDDDYRVVRFDVPGQGLTGPDPSGDYSMARSLQVLDGVMDALDLERAVLIGNSMGGLISWNAAVALPERVEGLVLLAPAAFPPENPDPAQLESTASALRSMQYVLPRASVEALLTGLYGNPDRLSAQTVSRYHDLWRREGNRLAMADRFEQTVLPDPVSALGAITAPTLLVWGSLDTLIPVAEGERIQAAMPDADLVVLEGVGHMPMEEAPEESLAVVRPFLARIVLR